MVNRIAVCGSIGVGKTTAALALQNHFKATYVSENYVANPYLEGFYDDLKKNQTPNRFALGTELFFIKDLFDTHSIEFEDDIVIFDRTLYETTWVFAENLIENGVLSSDDGTLVRKIASDYCARFQGYDAYIYLRGEASTLLRRIAQRGREMEKGIGESYLKQLQLLYENMFENLITGNKIILNTDELTREQVIESLIVEVNGYLKNL